MKRLITAFLLSISTFLGAATLPEIKSATDLKSNIGKKVILSGIYTDPGKGFRSIKLGFISLEINDDSLYKTKPDGSLISILKSGEKVVVEALLGYFKGRTIPAEKYIPKQEVPPKPKEVNGKKYYVYPPKYYITKVKLIIRLKTY